MKAIARPIKYHGGKYYLAAKIAALMPAHVHYVEPYAGGLSVLLAKDPEGISEVVNDIDYELTNFWSVVQSDNFFAAFQRCIEATPFSEVEWEEGYSRAPGPLNDAIVFFVRCRQSLAGRQKTFAPLSKTRTRRGMNEQASAWWNAVDGLADVYYRLRRVVILCRPALEVIRSEDGPQTLFYLDPPYLHETRTSPDTYSHEMNAADHRELLNAVRQCQGKVLISGYPSELYADHLGDWQRHDFNMPNHAAGGKGKRRMVECVWCNF